MKFRLVLIAMLCFLLQALLISSLTMAMAQEEKIRALLFIAPSNPIRQTAIKEALRDAGFEVEDGNPQNGLSELLHGSFDVVIIEDTEAASILGDSKRWEKAPQQPVKILEQFIGQQGGGVVLVGAVPAFLGLSKIEHWFGFKRLEGHIVNFCEVVAEDAEVAREAGFRSGETIVSTSLGGKWIHYPKQQVKDIGVQAYLNLPPAIVAFTNQYFRGRVYWQSWIEPDNLGLAKLFIAGVMWAAGMFPIRVEPLPPSVAEDVANRIAQGLKQRNMANSPIAILPFRPVGVNPEDANRIQQVMVEPFHEDLTTSFINAGLRVVERAQLEKAIEELKLSAAGLTDRDIALRLGKLVPGSLLLIGSLSPRSGRKWVVNARILETQRGQVIYGEIVEWAEKRGRSGVSPMPIKVALEIGKELAEKLRAKQKDSPLAVLAFRIVGVEKATTKRLEVAIAQPLQEDLTTALVREGLKVLERSQLDKALEEIRRSKSGLTDERLALELGKFLPGTLIVIGSLSPRGEGNWVINARVLETEKGEAVVAVLYQFQTNREKHLQ